MCSHIKSILDYSIIGSVGEPWDFESIAGDNIFRGKVISIELSPKDEQILLCKISKFNFEGKDIDTVIAGERGRPKHDICAQLLAGERVICNFAFQANGSPIEIGKACVFLLENPTPKFMIGSLMLDT